MDEALLLKMVWLFLPLILSHVSAQSFSVVVPKTPVSGQIGGSVTLPCALSDNLDVRKLEVRWYRPTMYNNPALLYQNEKLEPSADGEYRGRVSLPGPLEKGDVSLKLDNLTLKDIGMYMCHVSSERWYEKNNVSLIMQVVGSTPILSMVNAGGGEVNVSCHSDGWQPKPSLTWSDRRNLIHPSHHTTTKVSEGLFSVSSWLLFSSSESSWVSCSVALPDSFGVIRESRVMPHVPTGGGIWMIAFIGALILLLLFIIGVAVYCVMNRQGTNTQNNVERPQPEDTPDQSKFTENQVENHSDINSLQPQTTAWWDQVKSFKVKITIDPEETPDFFRITHKGKSVVCLQPNKDLEEEKCKIFTLCRERFSSGQQYWELKVKEDHNQKLSWFVGVAAEEAKIDEKEEKEEKKQKEQKEQKEEKIDRIRLIPEKGFWVLGYKEEKGVYIIETRTPKALSDVGDDLSVIGVFLDCDNHTLSFYNAETQSHIYTYTSVTPRTSLRPLISPGTRDTKAVRIF